MTPKQELRPVIGIATKCGEIMQNVLVISAEKSEKASYKYNQHFVKVCKCNEKEVYA